MQLAMDNQWIAPKVGDTPHRPVQEEMQAL
jgi:hypothetical protein